MTHKAPFFIGCSIAIVSYILQAIKLKAESLFRDYVSPNYTSCEDLTYFNSKSFRIYKNREEFSPPEPIDENSTYVGPNLTDYLPLYDEWRNYFEVPVSINGSAVHVPTNIYECGKRMLLTYTHTYIFYTY